LSFMARLNHNIAALSEDLLAGLYVPGTKLVFAAPKRIESDGTHVYRPLCRQSFRDEVVEIALLCVLADHFEHALGDPEEDGFPKLWSFGNRLHLVTKANTRCFSVGNAQIYRDWGDDYARFVRDTETAFNKVLKRLAEKDRVALICTDLTSFYPSISRVRLRELIKKRVKPDLRATVDRTFGEYDVVVGPDVDPAHADLTRTGLAQGPAHSGFWANVYLAEFDDWIMSHLSQELKSQAIDCDLKFYARYVDDMRFVLRCGGPNSGKLIEAANAVITARLAPFNLTLSEGKTSDIVQDATGSLLTTGQVAERMQSITKRAYFPLPPEHLKELANEVRLLFHAETNVNVRSVTDPNAPKQTADVDAPKLLDNPGVRSDSRRRFAANKWCTILRDLGRMGVPWDEERKLFSQELVRVWHEDPGQVQILQRALELGIQTPEVTKILKRLYKLKETAGAFGYYAFILSYLLDTVSSSRLTLRGWPLLELAREVLEKNWTHSVLLNKVEQFLVFQGRPMTIAEKDLGADHRDLFWLLRNRIEGRLLNSQRIGSADEIAIICGLSLPIKKLILLEAVS
jgi:hypothetical protein